LGIPLAEIVGGLTVGNQELLHATVGRIRAELPITKAGLEAGDEHAEVLSGPSAPASG
jgi:hypothetical protein